MRCPFCAANRDRVVDSRESRDGDTIRRRRECLDCGRRFTSYEQIEELRRMVVKRDGTREEFSRGKLLAGLSRACEKRPARLRELDQVAYVRFASVYRRFEDIDAFLDVLEGLVTPAAPAPKAAPAKTERP